MGFSDHYLKNNFKLILIGICALAMTGVAEAQTFTANEIDPNNGAPGVSIEIYGSGFDATAANNTITFTPVSGGGGTSVTASNINGSKLKVTVPEGLSGGNYEISIERSSDNSTTTLSSYFGVITGGGDFGDPANIGQNVTIATNEARDTYAADLDGDGDLDIVSASSGDGTIAWYANDGSGNFGNQQVIYNNAIFALSVFAADLDQDGDMDVLSASEIDNTIAWYENDGAGNFGSQQVISNEAQGASSVSASDIDGDGDSDVIFTAEDANEVAWFENDGNGEFGSKVIIVSNLGEPKTPVTSDIDGDGDIDVAAGFSANNTVAWFENDGNGIFSTNANISTTANNVQSVFAADLDADGDEDLVSASVGDDKIAWYANDGGGNFGSQQIISDQAINCNFVIAADLNGDGFEDVISFSENSSGDRIMVWYENNSDGGFSRALPISTTINGGDYIEGADFNNDGTIDLVVSSYTQDKIVWYQNTDGPSGSLKLTRLQSRSGGEGQKLDIYGTNFDQQANNHTVTFTPATGGAGTDVTAASVYATTRITVEVPSNLSGGNYEISVTRDSDGSSDGLDVLFGHTTDGSYFDDPVSNQRVISSSADGANQVYSADIDNDGDMDVISVSEYDDKIAWYENDGSGNFGAQQIISSELDPEIDAGWTPGNSVQQIHLSDLNDDDNLDIIAALRPSSGEQRVVWYAYDGSGDNGFGPEKLISNAVGLVESVFSADMDQDGDIDIISLENGRLAWYKNDGTGNFGDSGFPGQYEISTYPTAGPDPQMRAFATDIDNDGMQDILFVTNGRGGVGWFRNQGAGSFGSRQNIDLQISDPGYITTGDIDNDGDQDLLASSKSGQSLVWFENGGAGIFGAEQEISTGNSYTSVLVSDIDGDGDLDPVASSTTEGNEIVWFRNDGNGSFDSIELISNTPDGISSVTNADLDNDGDQDLLSASFIGDRIAWYENDSRPVPTLSSVSPSSATPGSSITLTGTEFDVNASDNIITFSPDEGGDNTDTAPISISGTTELSINIPENLPAGPYTISLTRSSDGASATLGTTFDVLLGEQIVVDNNSVNKASGLRDVFAADLNGDGDVDIISASFADDKIAWYENDGSAGDGFGEQQIISTAADGATDIFAVDVDGDSDIDVLSVSENDGKVAWYANNGSGDFGTQQIIEDLTSSEIPKDIFAKDLNGDSHPDVIIPIEATSFFNSHSVAWYANNGSGIFGNRQTITTSVNIPTAVHADDFDGDSHNDVGYTSSGDGKIAWQSNDGTGTFETQSVVTTSVNSPQSVFSADLDGDNDQDLISASELDDKVAWYANDGTGNFGSQQIITTSADGAVSVFAADLDNDSDPDVISASNTDDKIAWYENQGSGNIGSQQTISSNADGANAVFAADLNGNGVVNVMSASTNDNTVAWYGDLASNNLPSSADGDAFGLQDERVVISTSDISFSDSDSGDELSSVKITSLPSSGTLALDETNTGTLNEGESIAVDAIISKSDLDAENITWFAPENGTSGYRVDSFNYKVSDGSEFSADSYTIYLSIEANEVTVQGDSGVNSWHFITSPFNVNISTLLSSVWTQGATGADTHDGTPNVYSFDESSQSFSAVLNLDRVISAGDGYAVYMYADEDPSTSGIQGDWPKTIPVSGTVRKGEVTKSVSNTDADNSGTLTNDEGWNLLGNPYGTPISVDNVLETFDNALTSVNLNVYVWDPNATGGAKYAVLPKSAGETISPFQSFFVRSMTPGESQTITFNKNIRTSVSASFRKENEEKSHVFKISLKKQDRDLQDHFKVRFKDGGKKGVDVYDAFHLTPFTDEQVQIFSVLGDQRISESVLPVHLEEEIVIPLHAKTSAEGKHNLEVTTTDLPADLNMELLDQQTGQRYHLEDELSLEIQLKADQAKVVEANRMSAEISSGHTTEHDSRFVLIISQGESTSNEENRELPDEITLDQNYPNPFNPITRIHYTLPENAQVSLKVYDLLGREVTTLVDKQQSSGNHSFSFDGRSLASGIYIYRLEAGGEVIVRKMTLLK